MQFNLNEVHPVRALLAVGAWASTIYMLLCGIPVPGEWWVIVTGVSIFYFEGELKK